MKADEVVIELASKLLNGISESLKKQESESVKKICFKSKESFTTKNYLNKIGCEQLNGPLLQGKLRRITQRGLDIKKNLSIGP